jgi:LysR family transcriptional regulator, glycine cleavage system transcriptional activator
MSDPRRLPPLNAIRAFDAAARHLSFKKAGRELNVTPGAISRHIVTLEDSLGVMLFDRLHRKVELTPSGQLFHREVRPALERIALAASTVSAGADDRVLRLKLPPTFAIRWFVPRLASFHARHPELSVQVTTSHDPVDFEREQVDAAIYWGEGIPRGLLGRRLFGERLAPVCSPKLLQDAKVQRGRMALEQLSQNVLLHSFRRPDDWGRWFTAAGLPRIKLERLLIFENSALTYQGALDGLGIAMAQLALISDDLKAGRLVLAHDFITELDTAYYLTYPRERASFARIRIFHDWMADAVTRNEVVSSDKGVSAGHPFEPSARHG